jgi:hypothetical protein
MDFWRALMYHVLIGCMHGVWLFLCTRYYVYRTLVVVRYARMIVYVVPLTAAQCHTSQAVYAQHTTMVSVLPGPIVALARLAL